MFRGFILITAMFLLGCGGGGGGGNSGDTGTPPGDTVGTGPYSVLASWTANREKAVNTTGGGYKVYYSQTSGFSISSAFVKTAAYVSGSAAPSSVTITGLDAGTYYFKVVAYSALVPPGGSSGATSSPSGEFSVTLP